MACRWEPRFRGALSIGQDGLDPRQLVVGQRGQGQAGVNVVDLRDPAGADQHRGDLGPAHQPADRHLGQGGAPLLGQRIQGAPVIAPKDLGRPGKLPLVVSVAGAEARALIRAELEKRGFREGADYVCAA